MSVGCSEDGSHSGGPGDCRMTSKLSALRPDEKSLLGFSANEFMSTVALTAQPVIFGWTNDRAADLFAAYAISSSAPITGSTTASVSIVPQGPVRWVEGGQSCVSYMEIDLSYAISTDDGQLNETVPMTLAVLNRDLPASGTVDMDVADLHGSFTAKVDSAYRVRVRLSIIVDGGKPYGGLALLVTPAPGGQELQISQVLMGSWPQ